MSCGGTGGHIVPALAIADTIRENNAKSRILFVGSEQGLEKELVPKAGYELMTLRVRGLSRSLSPANLRVLWQMGRAVARAEEILAEFCPDIVIGTGGYACYPTLRAAVKAGIPTAVHESNAIPGLAVKRLAGKVDRVWLNFAAAGEGISSKASICVVGNPLRRQATEKQSKQTGDTLRVLSFGGSLGADSLNRAVLDLMCEEQRMGGVEHLHATGKKHFDEVKQAFCALSLDRDPRFSLVPFIDNMPYHMAAADLVICRAGAMSISELAMLAKAAILIPSPNVTGNHQYKNAKMLVDRQAATMVCEDHLSDLVPTALSLLGSAAARERLSHNILKLAVPDANRRILTEIRELLRK